MNVISVTKIFLDLYPFIAPFPNIFSNNLCPTLFTYFCKSCIKCLFGSYDTAKCHRTSRSAKCLIYLTWVDIWSSELSFEIFPRTMVSMDTVPVGLCAGGPVIGYYGPSFL